VGPQRSGGGLLPERSGPPGSPQKQGLREERGVASQCQGKPSPRDALACPRDHEVQC
jgi:hypothetical protein